MKKNSDEILTLFSGPTLEEIAKIFDGENAEVGTADISSEKELSHVRSRSTLQSSKINREKTSDVRVSHIG